MKRDEPYQVRGEWNADDRGLLFHCNAVDLSGIRRMYVITNHQDSFIRAWHGHRREAKYATVLTGAAIVAAVRIDDWEKPAPNLPVHRFVLSEHLPSIVYIPPGCANGVKTLRADTKILFLSTSTVEESLADDIRFDPYYWNPWTIVER